MELIDFKSLNLTTEESRDMIKFLAQKRGSSTKKLLSTIKTNPRAKNNKNLITKSQQELRKTQQKLVKSQRELKKITKRINKITKRIKKSTTKINKTNKTITNLI